MSRWLWVRIPPGLSGRRQPSGPKHLDAVVCDRIRGRPDRVTRRPGRRIRGWQAQPVPPVTHHRQRGDVVITASTPPLHGGGGSSILPVSTKSSRRALLPGLAKLVAARQFHWAAPSGAAGRRRSPGLGQADNSEGSGTISPGGNRARRSDNSSRRPPPPPPSSLQAISSVAERGLHTPGQRGFESLIAYSIGSSCRLTIRTAAKERPGGASRVACIGKTQVRSSIGRASGS